MAWKEISSDYEGVFFRVAGGDAAPFGQVQEENAPRLETIITSEQSKVIKKSYGVNYNMTVPVTGFE